MILLGASQSGKSLLADSFSEALNFIDEGVGYESLFLPMESYSDSKSVLKLIGSGSQYVDSALGYLTLAAELNPRTCFVFENFENFRKQHPAFGPLEKKNMIADGLSAPLHPGAVKYYKEVGLM